MTALALACFDDEAPYLRARSRLVQDERHIVGEWLPYAAPSIGEGEGQQGIRTAIVAVGLLGAIGLFALTVWSALSAYPFDEGARPLFSWPAFIPAPIEFGALAAAIGGVIMLFRNGGLTRLHDSAFEIDEMLRASQGEFVIAIACDEGPDANAVLETVAEAGAVHSRLVTA